MALSQEEAEALTVFGDCQTQWNVIAGMGGGGRTGLMYSSVEAVVRSHGLEWSADLLRLVQLCEELILGQEAARREAEKNQ